MKIHFWAIDILSGQKAIEPNISLGPYIYDSEITIMIKSRFEVMMKGLQSFVEARWAKITTYELIKKSCTWSNDFPYFISCHFLYFQSTCRIGPIAYLICSFMLNQSTCTKRLNKWLISLGRFFLLISLVNITLICAMALKWFIQKLVIRLHQWFPTGGPWTPGSTERFKGFHDLCMKKMKAK